MSSMKSKKNLLWAIAIIAMSTYTYGVAGYFFYKNDIRGAVGSAILGFILTFIPFLIEYLRRRDPIEYYGLDFATLKKINLKVILMWAVLLPISLELIDRYVFGNAEIPGKGIIRAAKGNYLVLVSLPIFIFSAAFVEEIWFRGIIQFKLSHLRILERVNPYFAIIVQSILFGLAHVPFLSTNFSIPVKIWFFIDPAIGGIVMGYFDFKYQSLWPGWIIHFINNLWR